MVGARTFADVLDRHLHLEPVTYTRPASIATPSIWLPATLSEWTVVGLWRAGCRLQPEPPRPVRQLTAEQHDALLVLGSAANDRLDPSFDRAALKCAFRRAARRLHPDAHPDADPAKRRQLESSFGSARDAYLTLLALTAH